MRKRWVAALMAVALLGGVCAAVVPTMVASADTPEPPPIGAIVVGSAGPVCPSPTYSTIQSAIDAAAAGSTIYVCEGTYDESPVIDKPLVLDGAQYGVDAVSRDGSAEAVIDGVGGVTYTSGATSGTLDGFTLQGATGTAQEITAEGVGAGWQFVNNVIDVSNGGIAFNTDADPDPATTLIKRDSFIQSSPSAAPSGDAGQAVSVDGGTSANVKIAYDNFVNLSGPGSALSTAGAGPCGPTLDPAELSTGFAVIGNTFTESGASFTDPVNGPGFDDEPFVNLACTDSARVESNTVSLPAPDDTHAQGPVVLSGGDWTTEVDNNSLAGTGDPNAVGIALNSSSAAASGTGVSITANLISGFEDAIAVSGGSYAAPSGYTVARNLISASTTDGIAVLGGSGGTIRQNAVSGSADHDCDDTTSGSGSSSTADTWTGNGGATSDPAGLCSGFVAPSLSLPASASATVGSSFSLTVSASGYPTPTFRAPRGLPPGLSVTSDDNGHLTITGTPTPAAAGTHRVSLRATNVARSEASGASGSFVIQVDAAPVITSGPLVRAQPGRPLSFEIRARGVPRPSLSESGALPPGVTFTDHGNGTATLSGTPTSPAAASWPVVITATNSVRSTSSPLTLSTIEPARFGTAATDTVAVGVPFNFPITATGSPTPVVSETGALPAGVSFADIGGGSARLSGTPEAGASPAYHLTLTALTGSVSRIQHFTLRVESAPVFTSAPSISVTAGKAFGFRIRATGTPRPVLSESGTLPTGVIWRGGSAGTASLVGTPTTVGTWPVTVSAVSTSGTTAQDFTLVVTRS
ncbi:MAG: putative Ig domain-containing protein [Acidimicrobiales bacterium]